MESGAQHQQELKQKIELLINKGAIHEGSELLKKYGDLIQDEKWLLTTKAVIHLVNGELDLSEKLLKEGLIKYPYNADILFRAC